MKLVSITRNKINRLFFLVVAAILLINQSKQSELLFKNQIGSKDSNHSVAYSTIGLNASDNKVKSTGTFLYKRISKYKRLINNLKSHNKKRYVDYGREGEAMGGENVLINVSNCPRGYHRDDKFLYTMCYVFNDPYSTLNKGAWNGSLANSFCCLKDNMQWSAVTCAADNSKIFSNDPNKCEFAYFDKNNGQYLFKRCFKVLNNHCCMKYDCDPNDESLKWEFGNVKASTVTQSSNFKGFSTSSSSNTSSSSSFNSSSRSSSNVYQQSSSSTSSSSSSSSFSNDYSGFQGIGMNSQMGGNIEMSGGFSSSSYSESSSSFQSQSSNSYGGYWKKRRMKRRMKNKENEI